MGQVYEINNIIWFIFIYFVITGYLHEIGKLSKHDLAGEYNRGQRLYTSCQAQPSYS